MMKVQLLSFGLATGCGFVLLLLLGLPIVGLRAEIAAAKALEGSEGSEAKWADITQALTNSGVSSASLARVYNERAAALTTMIGSDKAHSELFALWGDSYNRVGAKATPTVSPAVLTLLLQSAGLGLQDGHANAGVLHTYGYLLSNTQTDYGPKRLRWTRPTIERGFGLPQGTIAPVPGDGTLLANVTQLFGTIAFRGDRARLKQLEQATAGAAVALKALPQPGSWGTRRLREVATFGTGDTARFVVLRTDIVRFPEATDQAADALLYLLVYSVEDPAGSPAKLITGFPLTQGRLDQLLDPAGLGASKPVSVQYNLYLHDGAEQASSGKREVIVVTDQPGTTPVLRGNQADWPPYFLNSGSDSKQLGLAGDLFQYCLPATGYTAQYAPHPIKRMVLDLNSGDLDFAVWSRNREREISTLFGNEPLFTARYMPVVRADSSIKINSISDFDGLRLGHLTGLNLSPDFNRYLDQRLRAGTLDVSDSEPASLLKLVAGRLDIFVMAEATVRWLARTNGLQDKIKILPYVIRKSDYFMAISKKSPRLGEVAKRELLSSVDGCLRRARVDGTYERIFAAYGQEAFTALAMPK